MMDVKRLIASRLVADSALAIATGATAYDNRIKTAFSQGPASPVSAAQPAYLTYKLLTQSEAGGRVKQPYFRIQIWATTMEIAETCSARVVALFDKKKLLTDTNRVIWSKQIYENDLTPEATSSVSYAGKTLDFRIGFEDVGTLPEA